ncbi:MAG: hypothetical protein ACOH2V_00450 [Candidatus Saccharimonadaceae bacterium]
MMAKKFKEGQVLVFKSFSDLDKGRYYYSGADQKHKPGTVLEYQEYVEINKCYKISVRLEGNGTYSMLESEFLEYDSIQDLEDPRKFFLCEFYCEKSTEVYALLTEHYAGCKEIMNTLQQQVQEFSDQEEYPFIGLDSTGAPEYADAYAFEINSARYFEDYTFYTYEELKSLLKRDYPTAAATKCYEKKLPMLPYECFAVHDTLNFESLTAPKKKSKSFFNF